MDLSKVNRVEVTPVDTRPGSSVDWVLSVPASDINWANHVRYLTDAELEYCLAQVTSKTKWQGLLKEMRRRGMGKC